MKLISNDPIFWKHQFSRLFLAHHNCRTLEITTLFGLFWWVEFDWFGSVFIGFVMVIFAWFPKRYLNQRRKHYARRYDKNSMHLNNCWWIQLLVCESNWIQRPTEWAHSSTRKYVCYIFFMVLCYKNHSQKYIFNIIVIGIFLKIAHVRVEKCEFDKFRRKFVAYFSHADSSMTHTNFSKSHDCARLFSISAEKSASISCLSLCFCVFVFSTFQWDENFARVSSTRNTSHKFTAHK